MDEEKDNIISFFEKKYGKGSMFKAAGQHNIGVDTVSTQSPLLDLALGGGFGVGRIVEIYGPESSGKTTLALHGIKTVQKSGGKVMFIDVENALDPDYAKDIGVSIEDMYVCQPDYGEQALNILDDGLDLGEFSLIVLDSVAALVPKAELEGEMGDSKIGLQARLMSQAMRKITAKANKKNCTVIFINQLREKIGVMFGNPEVTTGGNALKFYTSQRIDTRRVGKTMTDSNGTAIGHKMRIKVVKNKIAPPLKVVEIDLIYGKGFSRESDIVEIATNAGILEKSGSWYKHNGESIGQGKAAVVSVLEDNPDFATELLKQSLKSM